MPPFNKPIEGLQPGRALMERITQPFQFMKKNANCKAEGHRRCVHCALQQASDHTAFVATLAGPTAGEKRKSAALACACLCGKHNNDVITGKLDEAYLNFNIQNKVKCTVTDNGPTLLNLLKEFALKERGDPA